MKTKRITTKKILKLMLILILLLVAAAVAVNLVMVLKTRSRITSKEELDFAAVPESNPFSPLYRQMDAFRKSRPIPPEVLKRRGLPKGHHACDAVAAFVLSRPEHAVLEERYVVCETRSTVSAGQTVVDWNGRMERKPNVLLARSVDREEYARFYLDCLRSFDGGEA